ncbi:class I SAM-dependent methyltransferase [Dehalobacterium formicoaceticum]|uniref:class I SAM-dependent methyltransferase n=1 Tax=Dehalobacterium formicoaceticum TaxID=51515 RepID=UPI000B7DFED5|nr:class I SAM-dependent methyltransferase [Dehalobacterium formicoaceticum]
MMQHEPARLEMLLTKLAFLLYGKPVYKAFADRLPLYGGEQVLDFVCGMGTVAYYVAGRLPHGHLTCLDISERWLNTCRRTLRRYGNVSFLHAEALGLPEDSFDMVYCHFVLHDISEDDLRTVILALVKSLKSGGSLIFREPLDEAERLNIIKHLIEQNRLSLKDSRITDVPLMGNALESVYIKIKEVLS